MKRVTILFILLSSCTMQKKTPEYYFNQGKHYESEGDYVRAQKSLERAVAKNPEYIEGYMEHATICLFQDSFDLAIKDYTKVIALRPNRNNSDIYYLRGNVYYHSVRDTLACADFMRSCELNFNRACDAWRKYCKK